MPTLASLPTIEAPVALSLPPGCTNVKVKTMGADPSSSSNRVEVTTLEDTQRKYDNAPLIDAGPAHAGGITYSVSCSFFGVAPEPTPMGGEGWVCTEVETEYAVGDMIKGTATYVYIEPEGS